MYEFLEKSYDMFHPKPVLDGDDLYGKDRKAYDILHAPDDANIDRRKIKWAKRYLKAHGYELISSKKADELMKKHEEDKELSRFVQSKIIEKFPVFGYFLGRL